MCCPVATAANVMLKLAHNLADDMFMADYGFLAWHLQKIISPAMNTRMFENPITQDNLKICEHYGMEVISPASGYLACGDTAAGKMPEPEVLLQYILKEVPVQERLPRKKDPRDRRPDEGRPSTLSAILQTTVPERWDMPSRRRLLSAALT